MEQTTLTPQITPRKKSRRKLFIIISVVLVLMIIAAAVAFTLYSTAKKQVASTVASTSPSHAPVTKADVQKSLDKLNASYTQAKSDQAAAQKVVDQSKNQVKVGS